MPAYPYAPTLTPRPSLRKRKLLRRALVVASFILALALAMLFGRS